MTEVDSSITSSDNEDVGPFVALVTGTHYILAELYLDGGSLPGNSYDMSVSVTD